MKASQKTITVKVERTIPAAPLEAFNAWLDPKIPGNPWYEADKLLLNPQVDGFFYWRIHGTPHYGRFTKVERPGRLQHTWMSPYTTGLETTVTVTFEKQGDGTLMTLVHTGLPDSEGGRSHSRGWNYFLDRFPKHFKRAARTRK